MDLLAAYAWKLDNNEWKNGGSILYLLSDCVCCTDVELGVRQPHPTKRGLSFQLGVPVAIRGLKCALKK